MIIIIQTVANKNIFIENGNMVAAFVKLCALNLTILYVNSGKEGQN